MDGKSQMLLEKEPSFVLERIRLSGRHYDDDDDDEDDDDDCDGIDKFL